MTGQKNPRQSAATNPVALRPRPPRGMRWEELLCRPAGRPAKKRLLLFPSPPPPPLLRLPSPPLPSLTNFGRPTAKKYSAILEKHVPPNSRSRSLSLCFSAVTPREGGAANAGGGQGFILSHGAQYWCRCRTILYSTGVRSFVRMLDYVKILTQ